MMMSTVIAVALGIAPVNQGGSPAPVNGDYSSEVGRFSQVVDRRGMTHLRGFDRRSGAPFDLALDKSGNVEGTVGDWVVNLHVADVG